MSVGVIIPAAGKGKRMGGSVTKPFIMINGVPVLIKTLQIFEQHEEINEIVVVVEADFIESTKEMIINYAINKVSRVVAGGKERQESVYCGLQHLSTDWVLVHDAVRPMVSQQAITDLLAAVYHCDAAILAVPIKDTIKQTDEESFVTCTLPRSHLWAAQTPQGFSREVLLKAHLLGRNRNVTDDSALVEKIGVAVRCVVGEYSNIKLTTPEDMELI